MLDEQHGHVALVGEPPDEPRELGALALVEAGRGLVEHHDRRPRRDGPGDADEPAPAVRQLLGRLVEVAARARTRAPRPPRSDGRSWRPGQKRSVTHDSRDARRSLPARMFSSTLMSSNSSSDWNERRSPSRARCVAFNRSMRRSSSEIDPPLTGTKPVTASMSVVFPAPFGPIRPTTSPGRTSIDTSSTATHRTEADGQARRSTASRPATGSTSAGGSGARSAAPGDEVELLPHAAGRATTTSAMPFWWTMRITKRMSEPMMRSHWFLRLIQSSIDACADAADRVRRAEHRAEHVAETADHRVARGC